MTTAANKEGIRRYIEEVVNPGDLARVEHFVSADYVEVLDGKRHPVGSQGAKDHVRGVRETYPDLRVTIEAQIAEGDWVASAIVARGTHRGAWLGMQPTGKALTFTGVNLDKVVAGKIVEHGGAANLLVWCIRQMGIYWRASFGAGKAPRTQPDWEIWRGSATQPAPKGAVHKAPDF